MKKFFLIFSFAFLFFLTPFNVSASPFFPDLPEQYSDYDYIIYDYGDDVNLTLFKPGYSFYVLNGDVKTTTVSTVYVYELKNGSWVFKFSYTSGAGVINGISVSNIYANSKDIYSDSSLSSVVLKKNPIRIVTGTLGPAFQGVQPGAVMEIVVELIPIVVLSIVSYLGLRKAFHWLLLQLKGC